MGEERLLFLEVGFDGLADLNAAKGSLVDVAHGLAGAEHDTIGEANGLIEGVDIGDHVAPVLIEAVGEIVEIGVFTDYSGNAFDAGLLF